MLSGNLIKPIVLELKDKADNTIYNCYEHWGKFVTTPIFEYDKWLERYHYHNRGPNTAPDTNANANTIANTIAHWTKYIYGYSPKWET